MLFRSVAVITVSFGSNCCLIGWNVAFDDETHDVVVEQEIEKELDANFTSGKQIGRTMDQEKATDKVVAASSSLLFEASKIAAPGKIAKSISRDELLRSTRDLCNAFSNHGTIEEIIACFSSSRPEAIRLFEHGSLELGLPFLGKSFYGVQGVREYFTIVGDVLSYENMEFSDYVVDEEVMVVSVRGRAKFTWKSTGKSWNEVFIYRIQLDAENKILVYEVWADSGAAYVASRNDG